MNIFKVLWFAADLLLGGWMISLAMHNFNKKNYFGFGVDIMLTMAYIAFIVKCIFVA